MNSLQKTTAVAVAVAATVALFTTAASAEEVSGTEPVAIPADLAVCKVNMDLYSYHEKLEIVLTEKHGGQYLFYADAPKVNPVTGIFSGIALFYGNVSEPTGEGEHKLQWDSKNPKNCALTQDGKVIATYTLEQPASASASASAPAPGG